MDSLVDNEVGQLYEGFVTLSAREGSREVVLLLVVFPQAPRDDERLVAHRALHRPVQQLVPFEGRLVRQDLLAVLAVQRVVDLLVHFEHGDALELFPTLVAFLHDRFRSANAFLVGFQGGQGLEVLTAVRAPDEDLLKVHAGRFCLIGSPLQRVTWGFVVAHGIDLMSLESVQVFVAPLAVDAKIRPVDPVGLEVLVQGFNHIERLGTDRTHLQAFFGPIQNNKTLTW